MLRDSRAKTACLSIYLLVIFKKETNLQNIRHSCFYRMNIAQCCNVRNLLKCVVLFFSKHKNYKINISPASDFLACKHSTVALTVSTEAKCLENRARNNAFGRSHTLKPSAVGKLHNAKRIFSEILIRFVIKLVLESWACTLRKVQKVRPNTCLSP